MKSIACLVVAVSVTAEETDTLLQASRLQKHDKVGDEPDDEDVDLTDDDDDTSDDMPLNTDPQDFELRGGESEVLPCNRAGVIFQNIEEDCTNQDLFEWKGEVQGEFVEPEYNPTLYGEDEYWKTTKTNATAGWETLCVAYVNTQQHSGTCKQWCADQSTPTQQLVCNKGMDDAHLQSEGLYNWLGTEGYSPTKCTVNPATRLLEAKESTGKPIDQTENGCNAEWNTQICGCALVRAPVAPSPSPSLCGWVKPFPAGKSLPNRALEDCSYTDHHVWKGEIDGFTAPSYPANVYGSDDFWTTGKGLGDLAMGRWAGACVAYVMTWGKTCTQWCGDQDMQCVGGMDDAHHQRTPMNNWQSDNGWPVTKCSLFEKGHTRQTTANNGCDQQWKTQICACKAWDVTVR